MSDKLRVLTTTSSFAQISSRPLEMLAAAGIEYELNPYGRKFKPEESILHMHNIDGLIAGVEILDEDVLTHAPKLKVISRVGTGMDAIDFTATEKRGITVFNTPDAHVNAVAELTLAGILDMLRRVPQAHAALVQGTWKKRMGQLLRGKTVGIVGLGRTGKALTRLLQPFGVQVLAYDPILDESFAAEFHVSYLPLSTLLRQADIVTLHLPYSPQNRHILGVAQIELMKPGAFLVNCARGGLVDEGALAAALLTDKLGGAYLDTFEQEPYNGPLCGFENVVLTPHIGSYAAECRVQMETEAVANLLHYFQGDD